MPVYNESRTVEAVLREVVASPLEKEIIVVDDGSSDRSADIVTAFATSHPEVRLIRHERNQGKGAALRTGFQAVTGDVVVIQDADLEYDPRDYPKLVQPIFDGTADVVYGTRFNGSPRRVHLFWHTVGNKALTLLSNLCTGLNLTDMETGYKAFRVDVVRHFTLRSRDFRCEPEITAKIAKLRCRIYEVPISYRGRDYWEGKKIGWRDGVLAVLAIFRFSLFDDEESFDNEFRTLLGMSRLERYSLWMAEEIRPLLGQRVLELGAGIGQVTKYLTDRERYVVTDPNERHVRYLRNLFEHQPQVKVGGLDVEKEPWAVADGEKIDTVISMNLLEHLKDDAAAVRRCVSRLTLGGRVVALVPAHPWLFGRMDEELAHFRRYTRATLSALMQGAGLEIEHVAYFNKLGVPGWWFSGKILGRKAVPGWQSRVMNRLVTLARLEKWIPVPMGLSLIIAARKPAIGPEAELQARRGGPA